MRRGITRTINEKNNISAAKWLLILALVVALALLVYLLVKINQPLTTNASEQLFVVEAGSTASQVAKQLKDENLISKPFFFRLYLAVRGSEEGIQAGRYALSSTMSVREIVNRLVRGQTIQDAVRLTVIEGWNLNDIDNELQTLGVLSPDELFSITGRPRSGGAIDFSDEFEFLASRPETASLEGFLFPDTYFIAKEASAEAVVRKMLANFERKVIEDDAFQSQDSDLSLYEMVTLASIVEREVGRNVERGTVLSDAEQARLQDERRNVASVFFNRLALGMRLESDATVTYITGSRSARATLAETQIDSPYNTYQNAGLPPGPIANPSLDAILAVKEPAETDYLYFLTDSSGAAYFAETFEGHQQNRARYLD